MDARSALHAQVAHWQKPAAFPTVSKPLPEDVLVCAFKDRIETISMRSDAAAALELVRDIQELFGKVELRLVVDTSGKAPVEQKHDGRPVVLESKYPGKCKACGKAYGVGEQVKWRKGLGCFCVSCKA